ncbi:MAG: YeeE/YedE family protein [Crocinitomicaceae bacterium]
MDILLSYLKEPWPWYVAGPIITLTMLVISYWGKSFGISSTMRTMCAAVGGGKLSELFDFEWKRDVWNLIFVVGAIIGGYISAYFLTDYDTVNLSKETIKDLSELGVSVDAGLIPEQLFAWENVFTKYGFIFMILGSFLVGFGTRYAGGCTSGHAITGLSNLQIPSLLAVIGFFIGGLLMTHFLLPYLL